MKQPVKKIMRRAGQGLPALDPGNSIVKPVIQVAAVTPLPSAYQGIFIECYDALLWMNESMKQLEGLIHWLT
jgi:hypothetical protein